MITEALQNGRIIRKLSKTSMALTWQQLLFIIKNVIVRSWVVPDSEVWFALKVVVIRKYLYNNLVVLDDINTYIICCKNILSPLIILNPNSFTYHLLLSTN